MICYSFENTSDLGGSVYISGTTCSGVQAAYYLNYGESVCMNIELPIITCDNPVFSTQCYQFPSPTPTITQTTTPSQTNTPTITPTATLICLAGSGLTASSVAKVLTSGSTIYVGAFNATQYNSTPISNLFTINQVGSLLLSAVSINSQVSCITPQSDGKIMLGGSFTSVDGVSRNLIARLNSGGTLDTTFAIGTGFSGSSSSIQDIGISSSGDYFVGGQYTSYSGVSVNNIIKLTSTGSIDNSFAVGTGTNSIVNSVLVQPDGKVIIAGFFTSYSSTTRNRIVRLNTDGTIDNTFTIGTGFSNDVFQAILQPDGKIICVGNFGTYSGITADRVCRLNTDGTLDTTFTSLGFNGAVNDVAIDVDGNIIVTGQFTTYNGIPQSRIVKLSPDGSLFPTWNSGSGAGVAVFSVATLPNKRIIVGASSQTTYNGYFVPLLFLLNENGTLIDCDLVPVTPTPTNTQTPSTTPTTTKTPTPTRTSTPNVTPTTTPSSTCGTYTTQYLQTTLQSCHNFQLTLFDNPDFTGNANAVCDYVVSGCAYGDQGTIYCGTETIASGDHTHNFSLQPVLQPGECVSAFTVNSVSAACPCVNVIFNQTTPTPTPTITQTTTPSSTQTNTPTPSITQTMTPSPTSTPPCTYNIYTHGAVRATCADYCNTNYLIQTYDCASQAYGSLTIGDFIYGYAGQSGYLAYSNVFTDTNTGPFRIADIDGTGEILGIYVCSGGSCIPL